MNGVYSSSNDPYLWFIYGMGEIEFAWGQFQSSGWQFDSHWLTIKRTGINRVGELPVVDLGSNEIGQGGDHRLEDRVTFDVAGTQRVLLRDVEYVDSSLPTETHLRQAGHFGFTTDGSLESIHADVGNHAINFTTAIKDSSLFLGDGFDVVRLEDHLDVPGEQYWSLIRREGNLIDAYSLLTGRRVRMEDGLESLNGQAGKRNFGEVEQIIARFSDPDDPDYPEKTFVPGGPDIPNPGDQGLTTNIDLRSDGQTHSNSFNLAYFNFIRYTSDNVWVGEATIHDGTKWSTPSDRTVTSAKYGAGVAAPTLDGQLSVIGSSRNGTHDLIISERPNTAANPADEGAIDGQLRLYTRNVESGLYNEFNEVFIGTELADGAVDKSYTVGADSLLPGAGSDRIYQVGTSGTDDLRGWNGTSWVPVKVVNQLKSIDYTGQTPTFDRTFTNTLHDLIEQGAVPIAAPSVEDQNKTVKVGSTFYEWNGSSWVAVTAGDKVFLQTNGEYSVWDGSSLNEVLIVEPHHRVALYGFGGNDVLKGGAGRDYIFGGQSVYNLINSVTGNEVWGGAGADYFGAGSLDASGDPDGTSSVLNVAEGGFLQGYATDVIMDWHAGEDTLVVLENGVAVIGGLRDSIGLVSLTGNNIIDLRDYAAVATSDQDFDGARGGADRDLDPSNNALSTTQDWDATKSLDYIFDNQDIRDANSITNEDDRTVVNNGLIVTRGLNGDDIIFASAGHDYLYGNKGADLIVLSEGGNNRVYFDSFDSALVSPKLASIYVADFNDGADQFFVNKQVIDAFGGDTGRALSAVNVTGTYAQAIAYDPNINFLHDRFYSPSIYDANSSHRSNDGSGAFGDNSGTNTSSPFGGADGTTFGIGVGMFAAGLALTFIPFGQIAGRALMATGTLLGGGVTVIGTTEHENAIFTGNVGNYLNVITSDTLQAAGNTVVATSNDRKDAQVRFLDFFGGSDAGDGFVPVVEFTAHSGEGIHGYFALHSNEETFVFLVSSTDNLVENDEAIKVAEINGLLTAEDFKVYDGAADIYNPGTVTPIVILSPTIESIKDSASPTPKVPVDVNGEKRIDGVTNPLDVEISVNGTPSQNTYLMVYDGRDLIYDGSAQNLVDTDVDIISFVNNTYTLRDARAIGTVGVQTDTEVVNNVTVLRDLSKDNSFIVQDSIVNYSLVLIDGETGMPRRTSSGPITVSGGNNTIDGGDGDDTLNVTGTSAFINGATDAQIRGIETILLTAEDTNGDQAISDSDDSPFLDLSNQTDAYQDTGVNGFKIIGSSIADSIIASQGDDTILGGGGQDTIDLGDGGDDVVFFSYGSSGIGVDDQYDIVLNMVGGSDKIEIAASGTTNAAVLDGNGDPTYDANDQLITAPVNTIGFDDRDGDATRLMYETATLGANTAVSSATELLVVSNSVVGTTGDLTANIAAALDSAFDVDGLDGRAPSATTGLESDTSSTASSVLFAVKSNEPDKWWVGRYEDPAGAADGSVSGGNIEVFAMVETDSILDSFWLDTILAPQALSLSLPSDTYSSSPEYATNVDTFSVGGVVSGNSVYYSVNSGASWATTTSTSGIHLQDGTYGVGSIQVRQVDGSGNYSPISEITTNSLVMIVDTVDPSVGSLVKSGSDTGYAAFSAGLGDITFSWSVSDVNPFDTIVEYKLSTSSSWISVGAASNSAGTHSVNINDLSEGTYNWRVTHIDDAGNSTTTNGANFTLVPPDNIAPTATSFDTFAADGTGYFGYRFSDTGGSGLDLSSLSVTRADVQVRFEGVTTGGPDNDGWYNEYQDGYVVVGNELRIYPRRFNSSSNDQSGPVYDTWAGSDHRVYLTLSVSDNAGNTLSYNDNFLFDAGDVGYYTGTWSAASISDYLGGTDPTSAHPNYSG